MAPETSSTSGVGRGSYVTNPISTHVLSLPSTTASAPSVVTQATSGGGCLLAPLSNAPDLHFAWQAAVGLWQARERAPEEWVDDFRSASGDLEIPYAVALDRLAPIPDAHDPVVADGLLELDRLIRHALDELS
jgi:hypothetical protein